MSQNEFADRVRFSDWSHSGMNRQSKQQVTQTWSWRAAAFVEAASKYFPLEWLTLTDFTTVFRNQARSCLIEAAFFAAAFPFNSPEEWFGKLWKASCYFAINSSENKNNKLFVILSARVNFLNLTLAGKMTN